MHAGRMHHDTAKPRHSPLVLILAGEELLDLISLLGDFYDAATDLFGSDRRARVGVDDHKHLLSVDLANREARVHHDGVSPQGLLVVAGVRRATDGIEQEHTLLNGVRCWFQKHSLLTIARKAPSHAVVFSVSNPCHRRVIAKGFDEQ